MSRGCMPGPGFGPIRYIGSQIPPGANLGEVPVNFGPVGTGFGSVVTAF